MNKNKRILIVGLGLIGGSLAMALRNEGFHLSGIDIDEKTIDFAIENDIIDKPLPDDIQIKNADILILALYPNDTLKWIKKYRDLIKKSCIVIDVMGIKGELITLIQKELNDIELCSIHPMAGKEKGGIINASPTLFTNANLIITPTSLNKSETINEVINLGKLIKFKNIEILTPDEHDQMITYLSQLPHAIAVALMTMKDSSHLHVYSGDSFRDLTRIAKINENLWSELFLLNKDYLIDDIDTFIDSLNEIKLAVQQNDEEKLKRLFIKSTNSRKAFDK